MGKAVVDRNVSIEARPDMDVPCDGETGLPLATVSDQYYSLDHLVLGADLIERLESIISENNNFDMLVEHGLGPKQKILLCGPPGTGKTMSSKVLASSMGIPLVRVEFDSVISSFLGETGSNLRKIFDFAEKERCVLLFDEFDMVAKSRDDEMEHGEMKRVISSFMQLVDSYDGRSVLIAATNHRHLLDYAVWRRFDDVLLYDLPDAGMRSNLLEKYLASLGCEPGIGPGQLTGKTVGFSAADIAGMCRDAMRRALLAGRKRVGMDDLRWAVQEQRRRKKIVRRS